MKGFLLSVFRTSIALVIALVVMALLFVLYSKVETWWTKRGDAPYEQVRIWEDDLNSSAGFSVYARTKFLDNQLLLVVSISNKESGKLPSFSELNLSFVDADGFEVFRKSFSRSEMTRMTDSLGRESGFSVESSTDISRDDYARFSNLSTSWSPFVEAESTSIRLDPCESGISRAERLRRLRQFGPVSQRAENWFEAAGRSVHFYSDGGLLSCE